MADSPIVIGIDLGTTNSCAAYFINGNVQVLENREGLRITPSCVFFTPKGVAIVGGYGKSMSDIKPENGVYEIKRLIGKKFTDTNIQNSLDNWPFQVKSIENDDPVVVINTTDGIITKTPIELTSQILKHIKTDVEKKLDCVIEKVVITVPAYFNKRQREDTLISAREVRLTVLKLLNEPTAAALTYYLKKQGNVGDHSVVYDLGGGTFDVAILKRTKTKIETIAVDGDTNLGGHDFDNAIISYVCRELFQQYKFNPRDDRRMMRRLHERCQKAKHSLSCPDVTDAVIVLEGYVPGEAAVQIRLTRKHFEDLNSVLFKKTIDILDRCLKKVNLPKSSIKEVLLSGGSTRIPILQKMLEIYFDNKKVNKFVHPDECVAEGAAIQAAMLSDNSRQRIDCIQITDVTPLSLGIRVFPNLMFFVIRKNKPIPARHTASMSTTYDKQTSVDFNIYEGERLEASKNFYLAKLTISDLTPAPPGQCYINLTMSIDKDGILTVSAKEEYGNQVKDLKITYARGHRSDKEIQSALTDAAENVAEDELFKKFADYGTYLLNYCLRAIYNLKSKELTDKYKEEYDMCKKTLDWVESIDSSYETGAIIKETKKLQEKCEILVKKYNFSFMPKAI